MGLLSFLYRGSSSTSEKKATDSTDESKVKVEESNDKVVMATTSESDAMDTPVDDDGLVEGTTDCRRKASTRRSVSRRRTTHCTPEAEKRKVTVTSQDGKRGASWHEQSMHKVNNDRGTLAKSTGFLLRFMGDCFDRITGRKPT